MVLLWIRGTHAHQLRNFAATRSAPFRLRPAAAGNAAGGQSIAHQVLLGGHSAGYPLQRQLVAYKKCTAAREEKPIVNTYLAEVGTFPRQNSTKVLGKKTSC